MSIGTDQAAISGEAFAPNQALGHAWLDCLLEPVTQQVAVTEAAVPVLREGRVIGDGRS